MNLTENDHGSAELICGKEIEMPSIFRKKDLRFEKRASPLPEFAWHTSPKMAKLAKAEYLDFDVRSLDPGLFSFPYHFHRAAEELFFIISGEATLRSPEGFHNVAPGDLIFFEEGPTSAHQLYNHGDSPCVYLDIRTTPGIDICEYPDSGKINILPRLEVFESASKVGYYTGEDGVADHWPKKILKKPMSPRTDPTGRRRRAQTARRHD
jgi:uncharacterized cupin superfamily protein